MDIINFIFNSHKSKWGEFSINVPTLFPFISMFIDNTYISIALAKLQLFLYYRIFRRTTKVLIKFWKKDIWIRLIHDRNDPSKKIYYEYRYDDIDISLYHLVDEQIKTFIYFNNKNIKLEFTNEQIFLHQNRNLVIESLL